MKTICLLTLSFLCFLSLNTSAQTKRGKTHHPDTLYILHHGKYNVTTDYTENHILRSGTNMSVYIQNDSVVVIYYAFRNTDSYHSGNNHDGYTWQGGKLRYIRDKKGRVVTAKTDVTVTDELGHEMKFEDISVVVQ